MDRELFYMACAMNDLPIVKKLMNKDNINWKNTQDYGSTPLIRACYNGNYDVVYVHFWFLY